MKALICIGMEVFAGGAFVLLGVLGKMSDGVAIAILGFMTATYGAFSAANTSITKAFAPVNGKKEASPSVESVGAK